MTGRTKVCPSGDEDGAAPPAARRARRQAAIYRWRNPLAGALLPLALFWTYGECEQELLVWSLALSLVVAGIGLRAWSTLHCAYAQQRGKRLTTSGPYAGVRNPLYLGNVLILGGAYAASELLWLLPIGLAWALLVYGQVVQHEERRLGEKYGQAYAEYRAAVPRWIPRRGLRPWSCWPEGIARAVLLQSRAVLVLLPFALKEWSLPRLWLGG